MPVASKRKRPVGENAYGKSSWRWIWTNLLPPVVRRFLSRRCQELVGLALVLGAIGLAISLVSFSSADPTWNQATGEVPINLLGTPGAIAADLALQIFGLLSLILVIPTAGLGWALLRHQPVLPEGWLPRVRFSAWPISFLSLAAFGSAIAAPQAWPFAVGLGGLVGDQILQGVAQLFITQLDRGAAFFGAAISTGFIGLAGIAFATGFGAREAWATAAFCVRKTREFAARYRELDVFGVPDDATKQEPKLAPMDQLRAVARASDFVPERVTADDALEEDDAYEEPVTTNRVKRGPARLKKGKRERKEAQPSFKLRERDFELPPLNLLAKPKGRPQSETVSDESLEQNARLLESVLDDFGIRGEIIQVRPGPVVTLYELEPAPGIKSSRIIGLADDIARSMSAVSARVAVIPGRNVIGIELPNARREMVYLRELLSSIEYETSKSPLTLALGKNIGGEPITADLAQMPHLLVAGTTGSGKSVAINTMILSLLYRLSPDDCKLILIDPKMLELSVYDGIPHLLSPVVTDPKKAIVALKWVVREMEDRYRKMSKLGVRNITGFNARLADAEQKGEELKRTIQTGFDKETGEPIFEEEYMELDPMPFIVVIVDEMADLMMVAGKEIEGAVQRLAQMARAAGIHMITATQRPSVDVITGTIKANFPTRISFQVTSKIDSRTILGEQGAEQLLGQGDMLYMAGGGRIRRVHSPFVSDDEVEQVVSFLKKQGMPDYVEAVTEGRDEEDGDDPFGLGMGGNSSDALYDKAVAIVARDRKVSTSYIQRRLQIGYNRAARIVEEMEEQGVISGPNHQGRREVLVGDHSA